MVTYFTDSDTDMTPELCREYGFRMISMPYSLDGQTIYPYEDFEVFDAHEYYEKMRHGALPTTSAISEQRYIDYFEPEFAAGNDILYVHFSAAMTNTFDFMRQALEKLKEKYPERKFYEVDTKGITLLSLNVVMSVGDLVKQGKTPEEIVEWAKTEVDRHAVYFTVDDLSFFHRSGRVGGLSAVMGTLVGIRPILSMKENGKMESVDKAKGQKKAIAYLADKVMELGDDVKNHRILIGNSDAPEMVESLKRELRARLGDDIDLPVYAVNPTAGAHCGPNCIGVTFHAIHR